MAEIDQIYKRAEEAFQKGNYDYARDLFMQILVMDPDHSLSRTALRATVKKKYETVGGAPGKLKLIALKGQVELQLKATKDPLKKIEVCQKHLNEDPSNSRIRTFLAELLLVQGHSNAAAAEAGMALETDKNVATAKILVAAYKNLGMVKDAQAILSSLTAQVKEDRELERLQRDLAAMETMKAGFEDAKSYRDVIKDKSQAEELEKRQHLIQTDEELQVVLKSLEAQLAENPADAKIPKKIADLLFEKRKDFAAARDWYKKAVQLAPQDSTLKDKVDDCSIRLSEAQIEAAAKAGDPKVAELKATLLAFKIKSFERRVSDRPTDMGLRYELGKGYYTAGPAYLDKAIGEFQQAVKDPKKAAEAHLYLGMAFQRKKIFDMADKQYEKAEAGTLSQERKLSILYNRAHCNAEAGNADKAIELGKKIMEVDISYKDISALVEKWQSLRKPPAN